MDRAFLGLAGLLLGFPLGFALGKSLRAALPALVKPRPSLFFYLDLPNQLANIFPYCPAVEAIRRVYSSSIDLPGRSMLNLSLRISVLWLKSGYTMKYCLSPRKIPWALPLGYPMGSGCISSYIPPLVTIQIQYLADPGEARGCSKNSLVINSVSESAFSSHSFTAPPRLNG